MTLKFQVPMSFEPFYRVLLIGALCWAGSVGAQNLKDPTQPPAAWLAAKAREAAGATKGTTGLPKVASVKEPEAPPPTLRLQTLKVGEPSNYAVINGQLLREGDSIEGGKVLSVGGSQVVLGFGKMTRILKLYPDIDKTGMK